MIESRSSRCLNTLGNRRWPTRTLSVASVVVLITLFELLALPAYGAGQPYAQISPTSGPNGTIISISGGNWPATDEITIAWTQGGGQTLIPYASRQSTAISTTIKVPNTQDNGLGAGVQLFVPGTDEQLIVYDCAIGTNGNCFSIYLSFHITGTPPVAGSSPPPNNPAPNNPAPNNPAPNNPAPNNPAPNNPAVPTPVGVPEQPGSAVTPVTVPNPIMFFTTKYGTCLGVKYAAKLLNGGLPVELGPEVKLLVTAITRTSDGAYVLNGVDGANNRVTFIVGEAVAIALIAVIDELAPYQTGPLITCLLDGKSGTHKKQDGLLTRTIKWVIKL